MKYVIHTDGGARGNPGPAAVGVVIEIRPISTNPTNEKSMVIEISKRIGETTNNVAEYTAVLYALQELKSQISRRCQSCYGASATKLKNQEGMEIQFFLDSTLVVNQLNGLFKIKDARLRELATRVHILEAEVGGEITYAAVRREQNKHADMLVNRALDE